MPFGFAKTKKGVFFPHLHCHSEFSVKDGCSSLETYGDRIVELGGTALCMTEHGQASGYARAYFACRDRKIKPIYGMEAYVNEYRLLPVREKLEEIRKRAKKGDPAFKEKAAKLDAFVKERFRPSRHSVILARTREGYRNLVRMSTDSWLHGFYYVPRTDTKFLAEHAEGLVYSTACIGGYIPSLARADYAAGVAEARRLMRVFGPESFYVELMATAYSKQREMNELMLRLAHDVGARTIVTCDVHYAKPEDQQAQSVLLLMRDKKTIKDKEAGEGVWQFDSKDLYWKTLEDVVACWREHHADYWPKEDFTRALANTYELVESIERWDFDTSLKLPGVFADPGPRLRELALAGFRDRLGSPSSRAPGKTKKEYGDRLARELSVVEGKGFAEYFLVLEDICRHARETGATIGPGRGSAGGSLIAYLLRITDVDPLRFGLLFERFLDPGRPDPPDIDLDFSPEHRDGIKAYITKRYPATATIGTFSTFKPRATLQDVGRVFGVPHLETLGVTKPLGTDADAVSWEQTLADFPTVRDWARRHPEAWGVVRTLKGLISHRGKNAAGVLIAPASALDDLPLMKDGDGTITTAFPDSQGDGVGYHGREVTRLGFLKMDILGVNGLNLAPRAVEVLARETGERVDLETLPLDDPEALAVANSGDVPGVFQLDTAVSRPILRRVGVETFMDLALVTALARPGPLENQLPERFAKLKRSGELWKATVPEALHDVLALERGLMIFQESVMHVCVRMAGMSMQEANAIRKIIGKKLKPEAFKEHEGKFVDGGIKLGHSKQELESIFASLASYSRYAFNASIGEDQEVWVRKFAPCNHTAIKLPLSQVEPGDLVVAEDGSWASVVANYDHGVLESFRVYFDGVKEPTVCTLDHRFPTPEGDRHLWQILSEDLEVLCESSEVARVPGLQGAGAGVSRVEGTRAELSAESCPGSAGSGGERKQHHSCSSGCSQKECEQVSGSMGQEQGRTKVCVGNCQGNFCSSRNPEVSSFGLGRLEKVSSEGVSGDDLAARLAQATECSREGYRGVPVSQVDLEGAGTNRSVSGPSAFGRLLSSQEVGNDRGGWAGTLLALSPEDVGPGPRVGSVDTVIGMVSHSDRAPIPQGHDSHEGRQAQACSCDQAREAGEDRVYRRVLRIEAAGYLPVRDLEIDHPTHRYFLANGVCTHNSHSVAYCLTAYRQLYMLSHYPQPYFAALLATTPRGRKKFGRDDEALVAYMRASMARGIPVLGPSIRDSGVEFDVDASGGIRYGLGKVKGVSSSAEAVVAVRDRISPLSLEGIVRNVDRREANARTFTALILAGAFDAVPYPEDLARGVEIDEPIERRNALLVAYARLTSTRREPELPDTYSPQTLRDQERELLGIALSWWASKEPVDLREFRGLRTIADVEREGLDRFGVLAEVARVKVHKGKRGTMAFLTLADETGTLENVVIWSDQWKNWHERMGKGKIAAFDLKRKENEDHQYGRFSYHLGDRRRGTGDPVEGLLRVRADLAEATDARVVRE